MIRIKRPEKPEMFSSPRLLAAVGRLVENYEDQERQERYQFDASILREAKTAVTDMCKGKCAYCESPIGTLSDGDVDNFRPKAGARGLEPNDYSPQHYWWLAYEWENLLLSCQVCGRKNKRDLFPVEGVRAAIGTRGAELRTERALLIDPTIDDPEDHLVFQNDGLVNPLTKQGATTIEILRLNRSELVQLRGIQAKTLEIDLDFLPQAAGNEILRQDIFRIVDRIGDLFSDSPSVEFAAVQRAVFLKWVETNMGVWAKVSTGRVFIPRLLVNSPDVKAQTERISRQVEELRKETERSQRERYETRRETGKILDFLKLVKRFSLKSIEIENFKSIGKLSLNIEPPKEGEDRESWLLLLGDNGIGKSSILQAITFALCGREQLERIAPDPAEFLKRGTDKGSVTIRSYENDEPIVLEFDNNGFRNTLESPPTFLVAFGSTRLLPKGNIEPEKNPLQYLNVGNLFDYSIALDDPREWLGRIDKIEFDERVAPVFFDVLALRGEDRLWLDAGRVKIRQHGDDHELENNSDGYKTIVALVAEIMRTLAVDAATFHNAYGIVLIDEIGNHLHPRWRMKIVGALRKAFPRLQFIVTTHEPLCLRGLSHGEVAVLVRDQENSIRALDKSLLPDHNLLRIDQLLTSDLFGLINVLDEETEKTYEDYYALLAKPKQERTVEEEVKIQEYSATLAQKEMLGSTPAMQAMFSVVNETYAQKIRDEGFKTKEELKSETITEVKEILKERGLDWL